MEDKNKTFGPLGTNDANRAGTAGAVRAGVGQAGATGAGQASMTSPGRVGVTNTTGISDVGRSTNANPIAATAAAQSNVEKDAAPVAVASGITQPVAKKKSNAMLLGLILCAILAVGGIGFGAWAMVDSNTQKANYEKRVSELTSQNNELANKIENSSNIDDCVVIEDDEDVSTEENTAEYIYVGQWGLKIKIPDNLKNVNYTVKSLSADNAGSVCVAGVAGDENVFPDFANLKNNYPGLGCVGRVLKGTEYHGATSVFTDDSYEYVFSSAQAVYSTDENEQNLELESLKLVSEMLKNADNYSAF